MHSVQPQVASEALVLKRNGRSKGGWGAAGPKMLAG